MADLGQLPGHLFQGFHQAECGERLDALAARPGYPGHLLGRLGTGRAGARRDRSGPSPGLADRHRSPGETRERRADDAYADRGCARRHACPHASAGSGVRPSSPVSEYATALPSSPEASVTSAWPAFPE